MSKLFSTCSILYSTCSLLLLKIYTYLLIFFNYEILTNFRKTVETGMDPRLLVYSLSNFISGNLC